MKLFSLTMTDQENKLVQKHLIKDLSGVVTDYLKESILKKAWNANP